MRNEEVGLVTEVSLITDQCSLAVKEDYPSNSRTSYFMTPNCDYYSKECKEKHLKEGDQNITAQMKN